MVISTDLITAYYNAQISQRVQTTFTGATRTSSSSQPSYEALPPWDPRGEVAALENLRRSVLANGNFFDTSFGDFAELDATTDEKSLFSIYTGLRGLLSLSSASGEKTASDFDRSFWNNRFQDGMTQLAVFFDSLDLQGVSVMRGQELSKAESELKIALGTTEYTTGIVHSGDFDAEVANFTGDTQFNITINKSGVESTVLIDLAGMGATTRNLDNVADYINSQLSANGYLTEFERTKIGEEDEDGIIAGNNFGFKIIGTLTEKVSFSPVTGANAVYLAGTSGIGDDSTGTLTRISDVAGGGTVDYTRRIEADGTVTETTSEEGETTTSTEENGLDIMSMARGDDGGLFVVGTTAHAVDGQTLKGESDLVLIRYDSTGKKLWSRVLGAADTASGASVTVDPNGDVIVAGSVTGTLSDTTEIGGTDSLVVKYSADGVEEWVHRFGATSDDQINSVSVGADGTIYLAGEANSSIGGVTNTGGTDGFIRALDSNGTLLYTRSSGTGTGTQTAEATAIASDGGLIVASEEDGQAVLRKFAAGDDGTGTPVWELNLGDLGSGWIGDITVDENGDIYFAGAAESGFAPSGPLTANSGGRDAVIVKISDGASATVDYTTFLGNADDNSATDITVAGGNIYISGKTSTAIAGATQTGDRNAFAAEFDAATGAFNWIQQISGRGGISSAESIVVDTTGDSALDRMGLPTGDLIFSDSRVITERSSIREGDHFYIAVDGGRKKKITIEAGDTLRSLTFKLNAILLLDGRADVRRSLTGESLVIEPRDGITVEFIAGAEGEDALAGLGLPAGAVTGKDLTGSSNDDKTSDAPKLFALEIPQTLDISSLENARLASELINSAIIEIQAAYRYLTRDPALDDLFSRDGPGKRGGTVPAYLQNQLANYSAGLERLGSGGSSTLGFF